jgi:mono/diheme cytochrome c family protein
MTRTTFGICVSALLTMTTPSATAQEHAALVEQGRAAFTRVGCSHCHMIRGAGTSIASDLSQVGARYSIAYLQRWLRDPRELHPSGHMPPLELTESDIEALAAYLAAQRGGTQP